MSSWAIKKSGTSKSGRWPAVETVDIPSIRKAAKIAATKNSSQQDKAAFSRALVEDVSVRTKSLLRKFG